ncbi:MAG TPA: hypothetical protein VF657_19585 [Actinoplanes sp.]|jgi:hypothetical protein
MRHAVFLVKNGIGFGHIRRALLIAEAVQAAGRLRPVVISQASSLALYRDTSVRVVNFPLLHRVPSAITEDFYTDLLGRLLDRLNPAVIIEDTYPDARYRRLDALADRPRILVMRRLDGLSFDQIRERGDLAHYDRILIAQNQGDFRQEGHSGESLAAVASSGRFALMGNIAGTVSAADVSAVRHEYAQDTPLIVVNGGAGGDQMPDGYGDRLFHACQQIAATFAQERHPARFVFVTGPYYAGRPLHLTRNVTVRRFEPRLAALLAAADVAVIKPGNNALSEALAGSARLVLVPDVSFMEGLDEHADRIAARHGGAVGVPDRTSLEPLIRAALDRPPRFDRVAPSRTAVDAVVDEIHRQADGGRQVHVRSKTLLLALVPPDHRDPRSLGQDLPEELQGAVVVGDDAIIRLSRAGNVFNGTPRAVLVDDEPGAQRAQELVDGGTVMLIQRHSPPAVTRWLRMRPPSPALLTVSAEFVVARSNLPEAVPRRITRLLDCNAAAVVVLDLGRLSSDELPTFLHSLGRWLSTQPVRLAGIPETAALLADRLLGR